MYKYTTNDIDVWLFTDITYNSGIQTEIVFGNGINYKGKISFDHSYILFSKFIQIAIQINEKSILSVTADNIKQTDSVKSRLSL